MHMILLWPPLYEREPLCLCLLTQANRGRQACSSRWNRLWWNSEWEQGKMSAYTDVPRQISVCVWCALPTGPGGTLSLSLLSISFCQLWPLFVSTASASPLTDTYIGERICCCTALHTQHTLASSPLPCHCICATIRMCMCYAPIPSVCVCVIVCATSVRAHCRDTGKPKNQFEREHRKLTPFLICFFFFLSSSCFSLFSPSLSFLVLLFLRFSWKILLLN